MGAVWYDVSASGVDELALGLLALGVALLTSWVSLLAGRVVASTSSLLTCHFFLLPVLPLGRAVGGDVPGLVAEVADSILCRCRHESRFYHLYSMFPGMWIL